MLHPHVIDVIIVKYVCLLGTLNNPSKHCVRKSKQLI